MIVFEKHKSQVNNNSMSGNSKNFFAVIVIYIYIYISWTSNQLIIYLHEYVYLELFMIFEIEIIVGKIYNLHTYR